MTTGPDEDPRYAGDEDDPLEDLRAEERALIKTMDALNEAPDTEFYVRIFNTLGERLSAVKADITGMENERWERQAS